MARGGILLSRHGMSPLIATVLLMAFAVALGGMIMNWSIDVSINNECKNIDVAVTKFCSQDSTIVVEMRNRGMALRGIQLNILSEEIEHVVNVKNSALGEGERLALSIPFAVPEEARVDLIGVIGSQADQYVCKEMPIERVDPIQPC